MSPAVIRPLVLLGAAAWLAACGGGQDVAVPEGAATGAGLDTLAVSPGGQGG
jgi:hypothetical protein